MAAAELNLIHSSMQPAKPTTSLDELLKSIYVTCLRIRFSSAHLGHRSFVRQNAIPKRIHGAALTAFISLVEIQKYLEIHQQPQIAEFSQLPLASVKSDSDACRPNSDQLDAVFRLSSSPPETLSKRSRKCLFSPEEQAKSLSGLTLPCYRPSFVGSNVFSRGQDHAHSATTPNAPFQLDRPVSNPSNQTYRSQRICHSSGLKTLQPRECSLHIASTQAVSPGAPHAQPKGSSLISCGSRLTERPYDWHVEAFGSEPRYKAHLPVVLSTAVDMANDPDAKVSQVMALCLPYLPAVDKLSSIAALSTSYYRLVFSESPLHHIDFCSPSPDSDLLFYPAFIKYFVPRLSRVLLSARVHCLENLALAGAIGPRLERLVICQVPSLHSHSSLLSRSLQETTSAAVRLLHSMPLELSTNQALSILMPLRPLASWLYALTHQCPALISLTVQFKPNFPYLLSSGLQTLLSETEVSDLDLNFLQLSYCRLSTLFFEQLVHACVFDTEPLSPLFPLEASPSHPNSLQAFACQHRRLHFDSLTELTIEHIVSPLPLTLFLGISFPRVRSLKLSTTAAFTTMNLVQFLTLFGWLKLESPVPLESVEIHHASNIAYPELLDTFQLMKHLRTLKLMSSTSFGSCVFLCHPQITELQVVISPNLSWSFDLPQLTHLVLQSSSSDSSLSSLKISELLQKTLCQSPHLQYFKLSGPTESLLCELHGRHAIVRAASLSPNPDAC